MLRVAWHRRGERRHLPASCNHADHLAVVARCRAAGRPRCVQADAPESAATTADNARRDNGLDRPPSVAAAADALNPLASPTRGRDRRDRQVHRADAATTRRMRMSSGAQGEITNEIDFVAPDRFRMQMPMRHPGRSSATPCT